MTGVYLMLAMAAAGCFAFVGGYFAGCWQCRIRKVRNKTKGELAYSYTQENPFNKPIRHLFSWSTLKMSAEKAAQNPQSFNR